MALIGAMDSVLFEESGDADRFRTAVAYFASSLGIEVSGEHTPREAGYRACPPGCSHAWVLRTWADVRRGDVVRMPGQEGTAAEVMELVTLEWHVNDIPPANATPEQAAAFARDVQYRPNHHAGEWTARPVTLRPLAADDPATRHRIPNVNPGAPVEIRCTQVELDAIELLGGWSQRVA